MNKFNIAKAWIVVLALTLLTTTGCGESPELRMQQAQIAMANGKPDQALKIVSSILEETPDNLEAVEIKARAQMLLAHLDDSKKTLNDLIAANPDSADARRHMIDWTWFRIRSVLSQSDFSSDSKLQEQFDEAMGEGQAQAEWLVTHDFTAEAYYDQAQYAIFDAQRLGRMVQGKKKSLTSASLDEDAQAHSDIVVEQMTKQAEGRLGDARQFLRRALDADPSHFKACELYSNLLAQAQQWSDLWVLAVQVTEVHDLPVTNAQGIVSALLTMPAAEQPIARRLEVGWKIQGAVTEARQDSPTWKITSARLHLTASEWPQAQALLEAALKSQPNNVDGQYLLARSLYGQKKYDQAKEILAKLSTKVARSPQVQTLYGLTLMQTGETALAKEALRLATDLNPGDAVAREAFLALLAEEGHIDEAQSDIDEYLKYHPSDPRAIRFKIQFEQGQGRPEVVADLLERVEVLSPLTVEHLRLLIDGYVMLQKPNKAYRYAKRLVKKRPDSLDSHMRLARVQLMRGKDAEVRQMLTKLREKFPDASSVEAMLGKLYLQRQSFDRSVELLEKVVENEPGNIDARLMLAQGYASLSLIDESLEQIDMVLEQDPQNMRAHALASRINQFTGRIDKANEHMAQIDESQLNEATSPALLAQLKMRKGDLDEAAAICNRAIASGNSDPVLRMIIAGIYIRQDDVEQAETHLLALIRLQPNNPQSYAMISRFYLEQKLLDKGLMELVNLQVLNEALSRLAQASLLNGAGRPNEALARLEPIYESLIRKRSPQAMLVANAMAKIHVSRGDRTTAHAVFEPMITAGLQTAQATLNQIDLTASMDEREDVVKKLDALTAILTPDQKRLRYQVMRRYARLGRGDRAMGLLEEWIALQPGESILLRWKAGLLSEMGKRDQAIKIYQEAVDLVPEQVGIRLLLAQANVANFDYPAAEAVLREAAQLDSGAKIAAMASLGRMYLGLGLNQQAADTFNEMERFGRPKDPRVIYAMGQAYAALKQDDLARQRLEEVPTFAPQYAAAQFLLTRLEQRNGLIDQARERLSTLARNRKTTAAAVRELLALNIRSRQVEELVKWSDKALSIEQLPLALRLQWLTVRATLAANAKNWTALLESLEQLSQLTPKSLKLITARIIMMDLLHKPEQARQLYRATPDLAKSPVGPAVAIFVGETPQAGVEQAKLYAYFGALATGQIDAARSAAEALPPMNAFYRSDLLAVLDRPDVDSPQMAQACRQLLGAMLALQVNISQVSVELVQGVVARIPSFIPAHSIQVRALLGTGDSIEPALAAIKQAPTSALAVYLRAYDAQAQDNFTEAVAFLQELIEREPDNYHLKYQLTQRLQQADQADQAIEVLQEIVVGDSPYKSAATNDLAYLLAENQPHRLDEAYEFAQQAIAAAPRSQPLLDTLGWVEHLRGNDAEALKHLSKAVVGLSGLPEVHYHLGMVYKGLGQDAWARYHLEEAAAGPEDRPDVDKAKAILEKWVK